ncbi:AAA family ATPase [Candidatus Kaiserbacteria bacterium]|nr:AAA family ATPase [Candidatus Kaiserbacteria bacterium]MCB9812556.1 AAA family ATPase [Candidatus Nomurabacteria bacterium]
MIIGITGSIGAGKGLAASYLVKEKGFQHFSARALITDEVERRGLPVNRDTMTNTANEMRAAGGPAYLFEKLVAAAEAAGGDVVIESVRAIAEVEYLKAHGGVLLAIDADPEVRYERIVNRGSETDHVTLAQWQAQEAREMHSDDPTKQNVSAVIALADHVIMNTESVESLQAKLDEFLHVFKR